MEIVVFLKFSSGNVITYYITEKTMMYQLKNVPTRGKLDGEIRIKAKNTTQYPIARYGELTAIGDWSVCHRTLWGVDGYRQLECLSNDLD